MYGVQINGAADSIQIHTFEVILSHLAAVKLTTLDHTYRYCDEYLYRMTVIVVIGDMWCDEYRTV